LTDFSERQVDMLHKQESRLEEIQNRTERLAQVQSDLKEIRRTLHGRLREHPGEKPAAWPPPAGLEERERRQP
jgi:predicted transcriptional regulator